MGNSCCGSVGDTVREATRKGNSRRKSDGPVLSKREVLEEGAKRMSVASHEQAQALFRQYRHRASTLSPETLAAQIGELSFHAKLQSPSEATSTPTSRPSFAGSGRSESMRMPRMTQRDLRRLLHDVDPELFEFVWGLFDVSGDGAVYSDDFVAAMALLTTSAEADVSIEEQVKACFVMFDTRNDGRLGYSEFRSMLEATVTLNLKRMLLTEAGLHHVEAHMEREFSKENLTFWQAVRAYRSASDRRATAEEIITQYVRAGSDEEVNLPHTIKNGVLREFEATGSDEQPPETLFSSAEEEIFKLMERDAYARFKSSPEAVGAVVDEFFAGADLSQDGFISFEEYRKWVLQQPQVIVFFSQLSQSILALLKSAAATPGLKEGAWRNSISDMSGVLTRQQTEAGDAMRPSGITLELPPAPDGPPPAPPQPAAQPPAPVLPPAPSEPAPEPPTAAAPAPSAATAEAPVAPAAAPSPPPATEEQT